MVPHKNSNANSTRYPVNTRFSTGPSAYLYDILSPLFEKTFAVEASKNFKSFFDAKAPVDPKVTPPVTPLAPTDNKINIDQLTGGFEANKWKPKDMTPADYIYTYTKLGNLSTLNRVRSYFGAAFSFFPLNVLHFSSGVKQKMLANYNLRP